jgi:cytochrome c nitrite reductase small subunit
VNWRLFTLAAFAGALLGLLLVVPVITEAQTYLSESPNTCINCHVMRPFFVNQQRSSHRDATCSDCHLPHDNAVKYLAYKSRDGMWDAWVFTTETYPYAIHLKEGSKSTVRDNCLRCHENAMAYAGLFDRSERFCGDCHRNVVHAMQLGQGSFTYAHYPKFPSMRKKLFGE